MVKTRNRYGVAFAGVVLHLMIGGVYAWRCYKTNCAADGMEGNGGLVCI